MEWLDTVVSEFYKGRKFEKVTAPLGEEEVWRGVVYVNIEEEPRQWAEQFRREIESGRVSEAIVVVPAQTNAPWWRGLIYRDPLVLFLHESPTALLYFGRERMRFIRYFLGKGWFAKVAVK